MPEGVLGAQLYTCRQSMQSLDEMAETFRKVSAIGYTAVQMSGYGRDLDTREIARLIQDSGLTVAATHMSWESFRNDLETVIETHTLWGCAHPAIGGLPDEYRTADGARRFADELAPIAEALAAEGMDFSYHNHNQELQRMAGDGRTWLAMVYEDIPGDVLKAEIDTYWIQAGGGDPAWWVRTCAGREPLIHLKDMCITAEREQRFAEIGQGNLNWEAILEAARAGGVQYYLIEQDNCYDKSPFESLEISYRYLVEMGLS